MFSGDECSQETTVLRTNDTAARQECASYNIKLLIYAPFGALCVYVRVIIDICTAASPKNVSVG